MSVFQSELDFASLNFKQSLTHELQTFFTATQLRCAVAETFTQGALTHSLTQILGPQHMVGGAICNTPQSFTSLCGTPTINTHAPSIDQALYYAKHIANNLSCQIGICILGILGSPHKDERQQAKVYLGYAYNENDYTKSLELSGRFEDIVQQSIQAVLGFLKHLFLKYPLKTKKEAITNG